MNPVAGLVGAACPEIGTTDPWEDRLSDLTLADRGKLIRCAHVATFDAAQAINALPYPPAVEPATMGYELFVIQYVSEGRANVARAVTALVYAPSGGPTGLPMVALGHGALGIGPRCGPSHVPSLTDSIAVPFAGRGYAVVAPDFAGNGVDNGMTSYLLGAPEAAAVLDGVRALRSLHDPRFDSAQLGNELAFVGHSQGGHAALFAHQLFGPDLNLSLLGSVAMAPGLGSARQWSTNYTGSSRPVSVMETFALASLYSRMLYVGAPPGDTWLTPQALVSVPSLLHDNCLSALVTSLSGAFGTLGDLYTPSFMAAAEACSFGSPEACPEFEPWASSFVADQPGEITSEHPSLILHGLADVVVPPSSAACIVDRMKARGTPVQACGYWGVDHSAIVPVGIGDAVRWIAGRRAGNTLEVCPAPLMAVCDAP